MERIRLKNFFDAKDTNNVEHAGFISSITLPTLPIVNAITTALLDDYIFNTISEKQVLRRWRDYIGNDGRIDPAFYGKASSALQVYLYHSEKIFDLTTYNFQSLTAREIETMLYGAKSETNEYGQVRISLTRGNDTTQNGSSTDTTTVSSETDTTENQTMPFDANTYQGKDKQLFDKGDETTETVHGAQTVTNTYGDTVSTTGSRTDERSEATHTDTRTTDKVVIMSPEKFFEIQKELSDIGAYSLMRDAVNECFCLEIF